jgi:hypothetical protein
LEDVRQEEIRLHQREGGQSVYLPLGDTWLHCTTRRQNIERTTEPIKTIPLHCSVRSNDAIGKCQLIVPGE